MTPPGEATGIGSVMLCARCMAVGKPRRAWSVFEGTALCIRHASEALHPEDQMREADATAAMYAELAALGVPDAY